MTNSNVDRLQSTDTNSAFGEVGVGVDILTSKVQMLEQIATDAVAAGRESNAIGAIHLLNELVGFDTGQKPGAH